MRAWLHKMHTHFPVRDTAWLLSDFGLLLFSFTWIAFGSGAIRCCATIR